MSTTRRSDSTAEKRWRLDPASSSAEFRVPHFWGAVTVKGHFDNLDGWLEIDHGGQRRLELTIEAASLDTGNAKRDAHLRSADFFDAQRHPQLHFHSTSVSDGVDGRLHVEGELIAAGHRVALEIQPMLQQADDHLQIDASTTIDQRQLGMGWSPLGVARTPTTVEIHAQLRPEA
jgi:polyisoprenoid-binding protein YceI